MNKNLLTNKFFKIGTIIILILLALTLPIILMSILSIVVKWGTIKINSLEIIIDFSKSIDIGDYLNYYFVIVGIEITAYLSYWLLQTSKQSNRLAKEINDKEKNRDNEKIRESALIIYYDIISKIRTLITLYNHKSFNVSSEIENKINNNSDWIKNIANLRDILTEYELETIFNLYNNFLLLSELQHNQIDKSNEIDNIVNILVNKLFIHPLVDYLWMDFDEIIESLLNSEYYIIFRKIFLTIEKKKIEINELKLQKNGKTKYVNCKFDEHGNIINGIDEWYIDENNLLYKFEYKNRKIVNGLFNNKRKELIFNCIFNDDNSCKDGYITYFYEPNKLKYKGNIKNGKYEGEGNSYFKSNSNKIEFSGIWEKGKKKYGEYKNSYQNALIKFFSGEYKNGRPYSGRIKCNYSYKISSDAYGFEGTIFKGKPINGTGYIVSNNYFSEEFILNNPEYDTSLSDEYDDDDREAYQEYLNSIPQEEIQEMAESNERNKKEIELEDLKEECGQVIELLSANWNDGVCKKETDDILNKEFIGRH